MPPTHPTRYDPQPPERFTLHGNDRDMWLGIDTGGTFTDFVLFDGRSLRVHKVLWRGGVGEVPRGIPGVGAASALGGGGGGGWCGVGGEKRGGGGGREGLQAGQRISGPALITEIVATTYLAAGWHCRVDDTGNLRLER